MQHNKQIDRKQKQEFPRFCIVSKEAKNYLPALKTHNLQLLPSTESERCNVMRAASDRCLRSYSVDYTDTA